MHGGGADARRAEGQILVVILRGDADELGRGGAARDDEIVEAPRRGAIGNLPRTSPGGPRGEGIAARARAEFGAALASWWWWWWLWSARRDSRRSREARIAVWRAARRSRRAGSGVGVADEDRDDGWTGSGGGRRGRRIGGDVDVDGVFADGISALEGLDSFPPIAAEG